MQVAVDSFVFAEGTVSASATTLDAISVGIGQPRSTYSNFQHDGRDQHGFRNSFERG
jgi:hypothetical protein